MVVGELIELLNALPSDREVYVSDDSMEYKMNRIIPEHEHMAGLGKTKTVVLITWDMENGE